MCLAGKKEQIMFSQQHRETPENALITFIFINWGIIIHFTTNWSLGAPESRTHDLPHGSPVLNQLSHRCVCGLILGFHKLVVTADS